MKIIGIETSCDETAVAVVKDGINLLGNVVASSMDIHVKYGGVVPEVAARMQIEVILPVIEQCLAQADCSWEEIDAIAVTYGPGLSGSLLVGILTARTLAIIYHKPLYAVDHVLAHVYANFITSSQLSYITTRSTTPIFPMLAIIVSGGHTQLAFFESHFNYKLLGETQDDSIGEAFDKVAKILGLPYPGGPSIAEKAKFGDPKAFTLPKAKMGKYDFSFSGLKTAVLRLAQSQIGESYDFPSIKLAERLNEAQKADIAASFQRIAIETVVDKVKIAYAEYSPASVVIAGGVAASQELRVQLKQAFPIAIDYPDVKLCTDNGAMVASLGYFMANNLVDKSDPYKLDISPNLSM
jgi:N6-L-threonylcarbamoyladenine synthase